jgi:hypothetical protein
VRCLNESIPAFTGLIGPLGPIAGQHEMLEHFMEHYWRLLEIIGPIAGIIAIIARAIIVGHKASLCPFPGVIGHLVTSSCFR